MHSEAMRKPKTIKVAMPNPISSSNNHHDDYPKHGFEDLPECLQHKILACLPLKSVFVFKSVSKQWNSSISTQDFSRSYVAANEGSSPNRTLLLLFDSINHDPMVLVPPLDHDDDSETTVSAYSTMNDRLWSSAAVNDNENPFTMLDFPFPKLQRNQIGDDEPYSVVSLCNGLLLCRTHEDEIYGICNPITRQWIVLPRHTWRYHDHMVVNEGFVAKVDKSSSRLISYRVVRLQGCKSSLSALRVEIYDSDVKKWTRSKVKLPGRGFFVTIEALQPAYLNEIIHWNFARGDVHYAAAVDPYKQGEDQCRLMVLPTTSIFTMKTTWDNLLGVCNGKLQYLKIRNESHDMSIWVLEDYDREIWVLKHMLTGVNLSYGERYEFDHGVCRPLAFHPLDSNIIYIHCTAGYTIMIAFDIRKKTLLPLSTTRVDSYTGVFPFVLPLWPPIFDCPYKLDADL